MLVLFLSVLVLGVGTASVVVDRRLQARRQQADTAPEAESGVEAAAAEFFNLTGSLWRAPKGWFDRVMNRMPTDLPQQFREWAVEASGDETDMKEWLNGLSDEGLAAFTQHVRVFCSDMGFELQWLIEQKFQNQPELTQDTEKIVLHYCRACLQSAESQGSLDVYKQFLAYEQDPFSKKNRDFGEKLFAKMVEDGLVSASMSEFLSLSPKERQERALEGIREAAQTDHEAFNRAVQAIVQGSAGSSQTSASTEDSQPSTESDATS